MIWKFIFISCSIALIRAEINLQDLAVPDLDDVAAIKERCDEKGGSGTYENVKAAKQNLQTCLQGLVDFNVLKNEVEEAKKTGSMDEVFGKYCAKRPIVKNCIGNLTDAIRPCLEDSEKQAMNVTLEILRQLGEFVCYKDGDRIAMFVAEGGVECIKDHVEGIKTCVNTTFTASQQSSTNSFSNLFIDKKKCEDLDTLQVCVVEELEKCKDSTPANIVDALFRFIKRSACAKKHKRSPTLNRLLKRIIIHKRSLSSESKKNYNREQLDEIFEQRCKQNRDADAFKEFLSALNETKSCFSNKIQKNKMFAVSLEELQKNVNECVKDLLEKAENCLNDIEKFFPQLYLDMIHSLLEFAYANKEKFINKTREISGCLLQLATFRRNDPIDLYKSFSETVLTRDMACLKMEASKASVLETINKVCPDDAEVRELAAGYGEALLAPCNKRKL